MLQQGVNVADVAYFIGEDTPKMTGIAEPALPKGFQFDYINAEVIERDLFVKDGLLTLPHGTQYRILVLPQLKTILELLEKIKELLYDGAVVLGPAPERSPSGQNYGEADKQVKALAAELWDGLDGNRKKMACIGKGLLMVNMDMDDTWLPFAVYRIASFEKMCNCCTDIEQWSKRRFILSPTRKIRR